MIAMASQQGPWPKCLGLTGEDCAAYIESSTTQAQDSLDIVIVKHGSVSIRDFQKDRVRIFVDDQGIVNSIPGKG
jgi:Potato inhibitor I family